MYIFKKELFVRKGKLLMENKELAKAIFLDSFQKFAPIDIQSLSSMFKYMNDLNSLLDKLYDNGYQSGFNKAVSIDIHKN